MIMQVPVSDNAGPRSDIVWPEFMSEDKKTLGSNFILSIIFVSECTLSLRMAALMKYTK